MNKIKINKVVYNIKKILQDSKELKEFDLEDSNKKKFLFQLVLDKTPTLWKVNEKGFIEDNLIEVQNYKFI